MRTLGSVAVRTFWRARGRWLFTAVGIALGVAVLFAVQVANASARRTVERRFGSTELVTLQLTSVDQRLPTEAVRAAARLDGVHVVNSHVGVDVRILGRERDGEPWTERLASNDVRRGPAFDPNVDRGPEFAWDGREPRRGTDEITIGATTAADLDVSLGDRLTIEAPAGRRQLTLVQIGRRRDGEPTAFGLATSSATLERLAGDAAVRQAYVQLADGVEGDEWIDDHRFDLPRDVVVNNSSFDIAAFREFAREMNNGLAVGALTAVFVGALLIFLTMTMQVSERTATLGTLRALGATRIQVARLVLTEALVLGVLATATGLGLGALLALGLNSAIGSLYQIEAPALTVTTLAVALAAMVGVGMTALGAAVPAWRASRFDPVAAMRRDLPDPRTRRWLAPAGVAIAVAALVMAIVRPPTDNDPTLLVLLAGVVLALPLVVRPLAAGVGWLTSRLAPGVGRVGVLHLQKERSRSGYTMGLVMVVMATVFALGSVHRTFELAVNRIVEQTLAADLSVYASGGFDNEAMESVERLPEVSTLTPFRSIPTRLAAPDRVYRAEVIAIDPDTYFDVLGLPLLRGDEADVHEALSSDGPAVVLSEHDARRLDLDLGDELALETTNGELAVTVVGVTANLDTRWHPIFMADHVAERSYGAGPAAGIRLAASAGTSLDELDRAVQAALDGRTDAFIRRGSDERADAGQFNDQFFAVFRVLVLIALVVGLLGLANTLAFSMIRRTREIGVLRATGTQSREIVAMVAIEALTLAGAAAALAVPVGITVAALVVKTVSAGIGATVHFQVAWIMVPVVALTGVVLALLAAAIPARHAARLEPVSALRFD